MTAYPRQTRTTLGHPMGLPIMAGCDAAWIWTRYCSDASCTAMQCLRSLCHSGAWLQLWVFLGKSLRTFHTWIVQYLPITIFNILQALSNWLLIIARQPFLDLAVDFLVDSWTEWSILDAIWMELMERERETARECSHALRFNAMIFEC